MVEGRTAALQRSTMLAPHHVSRFCVDGVPTGNHTVTESLSRTLAPQSDHAFVSSCVPRSRSEFSIVKRSKCVHVSDRSVLSGRVTRRRVSGSVCPPNILNVRQAGGATVLASIPVALRNRSIEQQSPKAVLSRTFYSAQGPGPSIR